MKKFISILFFGAMALAAFAQEQEEKYPNEWFVGVGAGFNYSFDTGRYSTGFDGKGVGTSLDLYAGKWFNRVFGMRLGYHGITTSADEKYQHDYGSHPFFYVHTDAMFRPLTWLLPYVHAGYVNVSHRTYGVHKGSLAGGVGLKFPIRAGKHLSFVPGIRFTMFNGDIMDYENVNTKTLRYKLSATVGIVYHWTSKRQPVRVETRYIDRTEYVPVEVHRVDTVTVKQVDTVYIREVIKEKEKDFNRIMSGLVLFDVNSSVLRPEAYPVLNDAALFLKENPYVTVIVEGHADITGNDRINQPLSERRARAVVDYLVRRGIEERRLTPIGYGSKRPIDTNETAEGRQMNRRMDFVFNYE